MSQVVVTDDVLSDRRKQSGQKESQIDTEYMVKSRMSDPTKPDLIPKLLALVGLPILAAWSALCGLIFLIMTIFKVIMNFVGKLIGGTKSYVIKEKFK